MRKTAIGAVLLAGALGAPALANVPPGQAQSTDEGVIDPRADAALGRMCGWVGRLPSFRVDTITTEEKVTPNGQKIQEVKQSQVSVKRPSGIAVDRVGPQGRVLFRFDGKRFNVYGAQANVFASAAAPPTIDQAIDEARDRYGIDAPGGDLFAADCRAALLDGVTVGRYVGREPIGGVMAHHIAVQKPDVDYQLWIEDGPQARPLRYVITSRDVEGQPEFTLELRNWRPMPLSTASFRLTPPPGAVRVILPVQRQ